MFVALYWLALVALGGFRNDHLTAGSVILVLGYAGRYARRMLSFAIPYLATLIIYDSQRFYSDLIRGPVHVSEPYDFDKRFFGIQTEQGILTPNEWFQLHLHPALDFITGLAYLIFFAIYIFVAGYFYFFPKSPRIRAEAPRLGWAFFWVNMIGYSTYYWYAAAPPWYVEIYGLGPANMSAAPNPAGTIRFDQMLGTHFFTEMYGRSADVFGAIPSLHVAYPLLTAFFAFRFRSLRVFSLGFYLLMCFSAVYLNHHYILDVIWGSAYALLVGWLICLKPWQQLVD